MSFTQGATSTRVFPPRSRGAGLLNPSAPVKALPRPHLPLCSAAFSGRSAAQTRVAGYSALPAPLSSPKRLSLTFRYWLRGLTRVMMPRYPQGTSFQNISLRIIHITKEVSQSKSLGICLGEDSRFDAVRSLVRRRLVHRGHLHVTKAASTPTGRQGAFPSCRRSWPRVWKEETSYVKKDSGVFCDQFI